MMGISAWWQQAALMPTLTPAHEDVALSAVGSCLVRATSLTAYPVRNLSTFPLTMATQPLYSPGMRLFKTNLLVEESTLPQFHC
jgi:hypothetical protein